MTKPLLLVERYGGLLARGRGTDSGLARLRLQQNSLAALSRFGAAGFRVLLLVDPGDDENAEWERDEVALTSFIESLLGSEACAVEATLRCQHAGTATCDCALPGIGLVAAVIADAGWDRHRSLIVGDRPQTRALGRALGVTSRVLDQYTDWNVVVHAALDAPRQAEVRRATRETDITVRVDLDRVADPKVATGLGFFDHMLEQLGKHGGFALEVACEGDLEVDEHHTIEDVALAIGKAIAEALGDKRGIARYGFLLPMDEAQAQVALDLSGRAYAIFEGEFPRDSVGGMPTELVGHFFRSLSDSLGAALHVSVRGDNAHHMVEACFKAVGRTLRQAIARAGSDLPSTKGVL